MLSSDINGQIQLPIRPAMFRMAGIRALRQAPRTAAAVCSSRDALYRLYAGSRVGRRDSYTNIALLYGVIVTVRQQSVNSFSSLHSIQGAGKGNLSSNY
jgi:hypothetical protein